MEHHPNLTIVGSPDTTPAELSALSAEDRLAARINRTQGVRRHGPAFGAFADAVGHVALLRDPQLFERSLVGHWPGLRHFVMDYVVESGLIAALDDLPDKIRPFVAINHVAVAAELQRELLILPVEREVWVFDAQGVVNSTVHKSGH